MKSKQSYILNRSITTMLIAAMLLFIVAIFGTMKTYAAVGDVKAEGTTPIPWKIVETTEGNELRLGKRTDGTSSDILGDEVAGIETEEEGAAWHQTSPSDRVSSDQKARSKWPWLADSLVGDITHISVENNIKVKGSISFIFSGMPQLKAISGLDEMDTTDCTEATCLFYYSKLNSAGETEPVGCPNLETIEGIGSWKTSNMGKMNGMFARIPKITELNLSNFDTSSCTNMGSMFAGCSGLKKLNLSGFDTSQVHAFSWMFDGCTNLEVITGLGGFNTSNATTMWRMFNGCENLKEIDVSNFDVQNVTHMGEMFCDCKRVETLDLSNFNAEKLSTMNSMFSSCEKLTELDLSNFNTENVTNMGGIFSNCKELKTVDLTGWDTSNATTMSWMFNECNNLEEIKGLDGFDTSNVTNMQRMFYNNSKFSTLDAFEFDMSNIENAAGMLRDCSAAISPAIEAKIIEKSEGKTPVEIATDPEIQALDNVKKIVAAAVTGKGLDGKWLNQDTWTDAVKEIAKQYSTAMIEDAKTAATGAIAAAAVAEAKALDNPTPANKAAAEDARKAAYQAVNKVKGMASNTDKNKDKNDAKALAKDLADVEADANARLAGDLNAKLQEVANAKTDGKSAASVRALNDAIEVANEALTNGDAAAKSKAIADLEKAVTGLKDKSVEEKAYDAAKAAADDAKTKADEAKAAYEAAKAKAEEEVKKNPGSDAAVAAAEAAKKAAEDYAAKAELANEKAKAAYEAANQTKNVELKREAHQQQSSADKEGKASDTASAEATVAYAEELDKAVENAVKSGDQVKAAELANKAAEAWKDAAGKSEGNPELSAKAAEAGTKAGEVATTTSNTALTTAITDAEKVDRSKYTPESLAALDAAVEQAKKVLADPASTPEQKAAAAKAVADAIKNLKTIDSKVGQEITVSKNVYVITKDPGATWDGEVTLKTAKNAKNVSVPKVVPYEGKNYEVNRVQAGAFKAKKIRKVTLGANIEKLDKNAFKGSKATTIVLKTKALKKASVKGALKGSKVKTVQVKVGSKKVNKKFVKKYKKIFTKKNAGKKVTVK